MGYGLIPWVDICPLSNHMNHHLYAWGFSTECRLLLAAVSIVAYATGQSQHEWKSNKSIGFDPKGNNDRNNLNSPNSLQKSAETMDKANGGKRGIDLHIPIYHHLNRSKICEVLDLFHTVTKRKEVSVGLGTNWINDCHVLHCFALNVCLPIILSGPVIFGYWWALGLCCFPFRRTEDFEQTTTLPCKSSGSHQDCCQSFCWCPIVWCNAWHLYVDQCVSWSCLHLAGAAHFNFEECDDDHTDHTRLVTIFFYTPIV